MNMQEKKYLSEEAKETIMNFFMYRGVNSKKKFEKLLITKHKYIDKHWEPNVSIVNFLLSCKEFNLSNSTVNNLYKLTQDWSSVDQNEENALFLLMKKDYPIKDVIKLSKEFNIDHNQKNNKGLFFVNHFLMEDNVQHIVDQAYKLINNFPEIRLSRYLKNYLQVILEFPDLFKQTIEFEKQKFDNIKKLLLTEDFKKYSNNKLGIVLGVDIDNVEKTLFYLALENQLKNKDIKVKKLKI